MSPPPQLAPVSPVDDSPLAEPISPELVLVDPVLAERARAALEPPPTRPRLSVAGRSPGELPAREVLRRPASPRPPTLPTLPNRPAVATLPVPTASPSARSNRSGAAAGAAVVAPTTQATPAAKSPEQAAPAAESRERRVETADRRGSSLPVLLFGIVVGLLGGIMAADTWMPPEPTFETAPSIAESGGGEAAENDAVAAAPSISGPKRGATDVAPRKASPPPSARKRPATRAAAKPGPSKQAGSNQATRRGSPASKPRARAAVTSPAFVWVAVPGARRYEVVFERGGKVVYSATTRSTRLQLPRSWRYEGKTYRLEPGRYRWTVWPIVAGSRGKPIVSSDYTV